MIILGNIFGVHGVLSAGPIADGIAFMIALILIIREVRKLGKRSQESQALESDTVVEAKSENKIVVTVSREYGSGGRYVAKLLSEKLGVKFYDKEIVTKLAEETGLSEEYIEENEQKRGILSTLENDQVTGLSSKDELFIKETELIKKLARKDSCVIVGRCADFILKNNRNVVKVFVYSDMEDKIKRATKFYGLNKEKAEKEIKNIDKQRANHYKYYTEREWKEYSNYDICINSDTFGVEKSADIIYDMIQNRK